MKETEIIEGCVSNDRKYQKMLVDEYAPMLYRIALRYVKDKDDANDVLQTTLINIFRSIHKYENYGSFKGWISRIAVNEALKFLRGLKRWSSSGDKHAEISKAVHEEPIGLENLLEEEIIELVQELPEIYRLVFLLAVVEGLDHNEIGEQLNIAASSSRSRLLRARNLLKEMYYRKFQTYTL